LATSRPGAECRTTCTNDVDFADAPAKKHSRSAAISSLADAEVAAEMWEVSIEEASGRCVASSHSVREGLSRLELAGSLTNHANALPDRRSWSLYGRDTHSRFNLFTLRRRGVCKRFHGLKQLVTNVPGLQISCKSSREHWGCLGAALCPRPVSPPSPPGRGKSSGPGRGAAVPGACRIQKTPPGRDAWRM
jgi:hypothetical protein